ncbi:MAG TPA: DUF3027 domain-containing protein [Jiangellales bacterium]|nr:DUF3027 domain-containing protein [Jiangellales bacterium]
MTPAPSRSRTYKADGACVAAVDTARAAAVETGGADEVGDYLGYDVEGDRVVTHYFGCTAVGYRGWRWSVTVARASRGKAVTVDECVLLPGPDAVLAPAWVPWEERVTPGDLGPGDLMPTPDDDPRLVPGYTGVDHDPDPLATKEVVDELGLGRARLLSPQGRDEAAARWRAGQGGPDTDIARAAPAPCETCAFMIPLSGALGRVFGVCSNERTPFDGRVVSHDHGCGAHSDVRVEQVSLDPPEPVFDTMSYDLVFDDDFDEESSRS